MNLDELFKLVQKERATDADSFGVLTLPAYLVEGIPAVKTEVQPEARLFGIPIHVAEWMPKGFGVAVTECGCDALERMQPDHAARHVRILDFRSEGERDAGD